MCAWLWVRVVMKNKIFMGLLGCNSSFVVIFIQYNVPELGFIQYLIIYLNLNKKGKCYIDIYKDIPTPSYVIQIRV